MYNLDNKLTDGLDRSITKAIYKGIEHNNTEVVEELVHFVSKILFKSFGEKNIHIFQQFISVPSYYYFKGYVAGSYQELSIDAAQVLTDILRFPIHIEIENAKSYEDLVKINQFLYFAFRGYSQLFYQIISNRDFKSFNKVIDKYRVAEPSHQHGYPSFINKDEKVDNDLEIIYKKEIEEFNKYANYHRRIKFALLAWLWFLYDNNVLDKKELLKFTDLIEFEYVDSNVLLEDLIFFNSNTFELFDWNRWDYMERRELQVYSPPQHEDWLTFGFILFNLKQYSIIGLEIDKIDNLELFKWLPDKLSEMFKRITQDYGKWKDILWPIKEHQPNNEIIDDSFNKIILVLNRLKRRYIRSINDIILNQKLSFDKVYAFKEGILNTFLKSSALREIFLSFKNINSTHELPSENKEDFIFKKIIGRAKMMFVEKNYQFIYGLYDWGSQLGREVDNRFIKNSLSKKAYKKYDDVINAVDISIEIISGKGFEPSIILLDPRSASSSKGLYTSSNFIPTWKIKEKREKSFNIGTYKDIPVFSIYANLFQNKILVCDFLKSFIAIELKRMQFFKDLLDINIAAINDEQAERIYEKKTLDWEKDEDGFPISKSEALELIKLSVEIGIKYSVAFKILSIDAFETIEISK